MKDLVERLKTLAARLADGFTDLRRRWRVLDRILATQERYTRRRGNVYAAGIAFNGVLALIPILMVVFAITAFFLASQPDLIDRITDAVLERVPGELGVQVDEIITTAIDSRATVGIVGLLGAAFTGIGWISLVRTGVTELWGGRVQRSAVATKFADLLIFVLLGLAFAATMALTALANSDLPGTLVEWLGFDGALATTLIRIASVVISISATALLFTFVIARLPLTPLPFRVALGAGFGTAVTFEILKTVGGIYLRSVLSSPAGAAFGPVLGVLVFAYLASRILLYATAWCASDPRNDDYRIVDYVEAEALAEAARPVVVAPLADVHPVPKPGVLAAAAGIGAAISAGAGYFARRYNRRRR